MARAPASQTRGGVRGSNPFKYTVAVAQLVRAFECGSKGRGFKSHRSPQSVNNTNKTMSEDTRTLEELREENEALEKDNQEQMEILEERTEELENK